MLPRKWIYGWSVGQSLGAENSDRIGHRQLNDDENLFKKIKRKKKENK